MVASYIDDLPVIHNISYGDLPLDVNAAPFVPSRQRNDPFEQLVRIVTAFYNFQVQPAKVMIKGNAEYLAWLNKINELIEYYNEIPFIIENSNTFVVLHGSLDLSLNKETCMIFFSCLDLSGKYYDLFGNNRKVKVLIRLSMLFREFNSSTTLKDYKKTLLCDQCLKAIKSIYNQCVAFIKEHAILC